MPLAATVDRHSHLSTRCEVSFQTLESTAFTFAARDNVVTSFIILTSAINIALGYLLAVYLGNNQGSRRAHVYARPVALPIQSLHRLPNFQSLNLHLLNLKWLQKNQL